ncbi:MAG: antibiotic biosynthesis monooxygenase family protein [bacterium]|nr:antibiotic biosynthesis monooxygenase [Gammaproteobacteria bacterium]HIL98376.1 antibiotic biosynthesis monooxygenase [Pseudomonadales bacterium]
MTTILAHIEIKPGKEEKFEAIMQDMVARTFAEESGVLRYEYFKGQKENFYYCLLAFKDKWSFFRHQNSDHHEGHDFGDVLLSIKLEYLDPVEGASPLPHTEDPPLTEEMDEGMKKAQALYPTTIASWWPGRK